MVQTPSLALFNPHADCLCRLCCPPALLLPGSFHLDVPGGGAALHHAGGGFWERTLPEEVLLFGWLRHACTDCGRISSGGLPELRHGQSVSGAWHCLDLARRDGTRDNKVKWRDLAGKGVLCRQSSARRHALPYFCVSNTVPDDTGQIPHCEMICKGIFLGKSIRENFITSLHNIRRGGCPKSRFGTVSARSSFFSNQRVFLIWMMKHCFLLPLF